MKPLLLSAALVLFSLPASAQVEPPPPADEHPLHTSARGFAKRHAREAALALAQGDRKSALDAYRKAVAQIPDADALRTEYHLYRARFTALALQLAADALEADDEASARSFLTQILAPDMDPGNSTAKNLLSVIDPSPLASADPDTTTTIPESPTLTTPVPATPPASADTTWTFTLGDTAPTISREWGFLLINNVDTGILVNGDIVELVREDTVLATFKVTIPEDNKNSLVLGVKGISPIPDSVRKGDTFRLLSE